MKDRIPINKSIDR